MRRRVGAGVLDVAYHEDGPGDGEVVLLLHGFPYDIHSYVDVAPALAAEGFRVIVPHLRGHGATRFLDPAIPRSSQQAALGADVVALLDALGIHRAVLAGYDWGARAARVVAALWPERCAGLVSVNSHLIQDIAAARHRRQRVRCAFHRPSTAPPGPRSRAQPAPGSPEGLRRRRPRGDPPTSLMEHR